MNESTPKRRGRPRQPIPDVKACGRCKTVKPVADFGWYAGRNRPKCYCRVCENEIAKSRAWTSEQRARRREMQSSERNRLLSQNVCPDCRERATNGATACEVCAVRRKFAEAQRREEKRKDRICPSCKENPLSLRRRLCDACSDTKGVRFRTYQRRWRDLQKRETMEKYGGVRCVCCGETTLHFLTIDHANNDGNVHRKQMKRERIYQWLKRNNYPPGFRVLCFNCNCGRQINGGICPHEEQRRAQAS